jgi:hypothetical protein
MIINQNENFKNDVNKSDLYELVGEINRRVNQGEFGFEHL